ncbi:MAG: hypothetical protein KY457_14150 [Actinobacteria bacterium]|nr:hypothetical protein [Actinomycetota bacterium]
MRTLPDPAAALCAKQHNVIARQQLLRWMTAKAADGLVRHGTLETLQRGVYGVVGGASPAEQEPMAALVRARPGARLTGPLVLGLLGIEPFTRDDPYTVLTAPGRRLRAVTFPHRPDPCPDRAITPIGPMPCVHPVAALVDAIPALQPRERRVAVHVLRRRGHWSAQRFAVEAAARGTSDPGIAILAEMIAGGVLESDSAEEAGLGDRLLAIDDRFEPQVWVTPRIRVDWFLRLLRLIVEYQGEVDHAGEDARRRDAARIAELEALGMLVVPVTAADVADPGLDGWIRGILAAREYELARASR